MANRVKLTTKQFTLYRKTQQEAVALMQAFEAARKNFNNVLELLVEVHGLEGDVNQVQLDDATGELFTTPPADVKPADAVPEPDKAK